jgi:hypothetical protein
MASDLQPMPTEAIQKRYQFIPFIESGRTITRISASMPSILVEATPLTAHFSFSIKLFSVVIAVRLPFANE